MFHHPYAEDQAQTIITYQQMKAYGLPGKRTQGTYLEGFKDKMPQGPEAAGCRRQALTHEDNPSIWHPMHSFEARTWKWVRTQPSYKPVRGHKNITTHTNLFQDGIVCDVVDRITPETQGGIRPCFQDIQRSGYCVQALTALFLMAPFLKKSL